MLWISVVILLVVNCQGDLMRRARQVRENTHAYAVNPPEESYTIQKQGPIPNVYARPSYTQDAYTTSSFGSNQGVQGNRPQNVYAVKPASNFGENVYAKPTQNLNGPEQNVYGKPTQNDYERPTQNAYGKPTHSDYDRPTQNAYGKPTNSDYNGATQNAYGKPSQGPTQNAYPVKHPGNFASPTTTQRPFQPNLLSGPSTPQPDNTQGIPKLIIDKDHSIYAKDASGVVLSPKNNEDCEVSKTIANGKSTCKGQLIFQENFDNLNANKWRHDVRIPGKPDHEFVVYVQSKNNSKVENGNLIIRPTLLSDYDPNHDVVVEGSLQLNDCRLGSDSGYCSKQATNYNILPPVVSSRLRTKNSFSFKYGTIKIRARMPRGDWLYPQLWLEPKDNAYGRGYPSGRIVLGLPRGNSVLVGPSKQTMGVQQLNAGCLFRTNENSGSNHGKYFQKMNEDGWDKSYHNYSTVWTPESMEFFVDDENLGSCPAPNLEGRRISPWRRGTKMAPFDEEFYISIGLAAGGISEFPDGSTNGREGERKPWRNSGAKALLSFYDEESNWWSSWSDNSELRVDSIEVHAL